MPIFAALVAACINGLTSFFGLAMAAQNAIAWARRTFILALMVGFTTAVSSCLTFLLGALSGASLPTRFLQGLGMFIPSNAVAIMSCLASVWLACVVVRLKLDGLKW